MVSFGKSLIRGAMAALMLMSSCARESNIFGCKVQLVSPKVVRTIEGTRIDIDTSLILGAVSIRYQDSILIVKASETADKNNLHHFSVVDGHHLGDFIKVGRGPSEMATCRLANCHTLSDGNKALYVMDLHTNSASDFMPKESIAKGTTVLNHLLKFKKRVLYAYPYQDSLHLTMFPEPDSFDAQILDGEGKVLQEFKLYDVSGITFYDKVCSCNAINPATGEIVIAMASLPQINFLNPKTGERRTLAVDKNYHDWKSMLNTENISIPYFYLKP